MTVKAESHFNLKKQRRITMEVKGSVKMEVRPIKCPLQKIMCVDCKYHVDTYVEKENDRLTATIVCDFDKMKGE